MCRRFVRLIGIELAEFAEIGRGRFEKAKDLAEQTGPGDEHDTEGDQQDLEYVRGLPIRIVALCYRAAVEGAARRRFALSLRDDVRRRRTNLLR